MVVAFVHVCVRFLTLVCNFHHTQRVKCGRGTCVQWMRRGIYGRSLRFFWKFRTINLLIQQAPISKHQLRLKTSKEIRTAEGKGRDFVDFNFNIFLQEMLYNYANFSMIHFPRFSDCLMILRALWFSMELCLLYWMRYDFARSVSFEASLLTLVNIWRFSDKHEFSDLSF